MEDDPTPPSYSPLSDTQEDKSTEEGNIISHDISGEDTDSASEVSICSRVNAIQGLKFVGDNVDKNIRPSFFRCENTGESLHYFHSYAVFGRIPISSLSDVPPTKTRVEPSIFLPTEEDISFVKDEMAILISRYVIFIIWI